MNAKRTCIALAAAALLALPGVALAEGIRVAVVDVAKVLNDSEAGKKAKKTLEERFDELRKSVEAKADEAKKAKEELESLKVLYDKSKGKEKVKAKEDALKEKAEAYQKAVQEAEKEMRAREQEMTRSIQKIIEEKVDQVVREEKYDLLLDARQGGTVLHHVQSLDITAKVLALVNGETGGAPPAPGK